MSILLGFVEKAVIPQMRENGKGRIINLSSALELLVPKPYTLYCK